MASSNVLGVQDAYQLINSIAAQALGTTGLTATDGSSFVKVAEAVMQTGLESTLNAIGYVLGRTIFSIRPYKAKLSTLERDPERFGMITRKITYLAMEAEKSNDWNTQIDGTQLADGNSIDMFKIKAPKAVQLCIPGAESLQDHYTRFRDQLRVAFSNEQEFIRFWEGASVEFYNMIETQKEAKSRNVLLNRIAGQVAMNQGVVDLVYDYNMVYGTSYSRWELLTTYAESFWKHVAARIKIDSDRLTDRSANYHAQLTGYAPIIRHVPKDRQRAIMYGPAFTASKTNVYSSLFNPQYLDIGEFESVNYWQAQDAPASVNYLPNILNTTTGEANAADAAVEIPYVLGILFDEEAMGIMPKFDYVSVTPFNSAGGYYNTYIHWLFKSYCDFTESAIVYVLGDIEGQEAKLNRVRYRTGSGGYQAVASFSPDTYSYSIAVSSASFRMIAFPDQPFSTVTYYLGVTEFQADSALTLSEGANVITVTVSAVGYESMEYEFTVTYTISKNGDDEPAEEPAEELKTRSTKSTK